MNHSFTTARRWSAAAALSATAAIHIALVPGHLREAPYAGALFIALAASALITGVLLLAAADRFAWGAAGALAALAVVGYAVSRSIGLPSMSDDIGDWLNPLGLAALACEAAVVTMAARALAAAGT